MDLRLKYNDETIALAVETDGDSRFSAAIGDKKFVVAFERISEHLIRLIVDGRQTVAFVAETPEGKVVMVDGRTFVLADDRASASRARAGAKSGPKAVTPPMPAVVTKILVAQGESVEKGQGLLVVSAMKMDTVLTAPYDGIVTKINVAEGEKVVPKQVLVDIEAATAEANTDPT